MKTAEEILREVGITDDSYFTTSTGFEKVEKAMKAYASEAIDRCAENACTENIGRDYVPHYVVDKESILEIKNELK